jgi:hypothetical protein
MVRERRKRTRVPVGFDMDVTMKGKKIKVKTLNLSLTGVRFAGSQPFKTGAACTIEIHLHDEAHLIIEAKILRADAEETVASFLSMDEDSFYHLKNLLLYNAADADQIEKELENPAFS